MKRRRDAIVLAVSFLAHLALLAAWMSTRSQLNFPEPPTIEAQLVRLPPRPNAKLETPPRPPRTPPAIQPHPETTPLPDTIAPLPIPPRPAPGSEIAPEWRVKPETAIAGAHTGSPFGAGQTAAQRIRPPPCKTSQDHSDLPGPPCPTQSAEEQASHYSAAKDSRTAGFEAEGAHKRAMKRYHELPGAAGYPGIACAVLHRC